MITSWENILFLGLKAPPIGWLKWEKCNIFTQKTAGPTEHPVSCHILQIAALRVCMMSKIKWTLTYFRGLCRFGTQNDALLREALWKEGLSWDRKGLDFASDVFLMMETIGFLCKRVASTLPCHKNEQNWTKSNTVAW